MAKQYWGKGEEPDQPPKRGFGWFAFVGRGEDDPPERPTRFKIVDEYGREREVFAPRGFVSRIPWPLR